METGMGVGVSGSTHVVGECHALWPVAFVDFVWRRSQPGETGRGDSQPAQPGGIANRKGLVL